MAATVCPFVYVTVCHWLVDRNTYDHMPLFLWGLFALAYSAAWFVIFAMFLYFLLWLLWHDDFRGEIPEGHVHLWDILD